MIWIVLAVSGLGILAFYWILIFSLMCAASRSDLFTDEFLLDAPLDFGYARDALPRSLSESQIEMEF